MKHLLKLLAASFVVWTLPEPGFGQNSSTKTEEVFVYRDSDFAENHGKWTNFMPDEEASTHLSVSLINKTDPYRGSTCARFEVKSWPTQGWVGIAAACKEDYWGEKPFDKAYSLTGMRKLVFYARGNEGGESIQVKALITGDKPHGDSAKEPVESEWITLGKTWKRYEVDVRSADLKRVVTPFAVFADIAHNDAKGIVFYLDHVHYIVDDK